MAHTFDTSVRNPATANTSSTANPLDTTFTPGAGATVIALTIAYAGATNDRAGGAPTLVEDSLTFTQADQVRRGPTPEGSVELWYLLAPPTGSAKTIRVPNSGGYAMVVTVSSYKAQSGYASALDVANGGAAQTASPSVSVTTTVNGDAIVAAIFTDNNGWTPTARSGTQLYDDDNGGWGEGAQYLLQATAGEQAMGWTFTGTGDWGLCVAAFKEVASGVTVTPAAVYSVSSTVNPTTVLGPVSITPNPAYSAPSVVAPTVVLGSVSIADKLAAAAGTVVAPTVQFGGGLTVTPNPASGAGAVIAPAVILGSLAILNKIASAVGVTINPTVLHGSMTVTPGPADAAGLTVAPNVSIYDPGAPATRKRLVDYLWWIR